MEMSVVAAAAAVAAVAANNMNNIGVGFGTAGLGNQCYAVVIMALEMGFRKFDTAEADYWYDQSAVGKALQDFFSSSSSSSNDDECVDPNNEEFCSTTAITTASRCATEDLRISTKIPPWSLTSAESIRQNAARSRQELVGFCDGNANDDEKGDKNNNNNNNNNISIKKYPLDVYYIHAPDCWPGWHPRCDNNIHPHAHPLLDLRSAWLAMEAVVGFDHSAQRIGLSNVYPPQLLDIIHFVQERQAQAAQVVYHHGGTTMDMDTPDTPPPPRMPDVLQAYADPIKPADELRRICQEHGIEFVSYSTLGTQHRIRQQDGKNINPVLDSPIVQSIAQKHARSTAEVVLSWARQKDMSVIPRSSKREHIRELARLLFLSSPPDDAAAAAGFLDADDMRQMDTLKDASFGLMNFN